MLRRNTNKLFGEDVRMRRISALKYVMNNKRRVCLLIFSFGLFLAVNYSYDILINSGYSSISDINIKPGEKFQVICLNAKEISTFSEDETTKMINEVNHAFSTIPQTNIKQAIMCDMVCFRVNTVIGAQDMGTVFLTDKEHVADFLDYTGAQLVSSEMRLPQNPAEVLLGETFAKIIKKGVYDTIPTAKSKPYKIVGIIKYNTNEPCYLSVGVKYNDSYPSGIVLFANGMETINGEKQAAINYTDIIKNNPTLGAFMSKGLFEYVFDYTERERLQKSYSEIINRASAMIKTISTITVFISLLMIFNLYMKDRYSEWCLYNSIGYSSKDIYLLIVRELLIILGCSVLIAVVWSIIIYFFMYMLVIEPLCLTPFLYIPGGIFECLSILVMFFGVLQASVFYAIQRIKTVDAVDESFL